MNSGENITAMPKLCAGDPRRVGRTVREVRLVDHPNRTRRAGIKALRRMAGREKRLSPTWRTVIRQDVDAALAEALTWRQFIRELESKGYELNFNHKYPTLRPPGKTRPVRFKTLGRQYTSEALQIRILYPDARWHFLQEQPPVAKHARLRKSYGKAAGSPACGPCTIAICTSWVRCRISPAAPAMLYGRTSVILTEGSGRWSFCRQTALIR